MPRLEAINAATYSKKCTRQFVFSGDLMTIGYNTTKGRIWDLDRITKMHKGAAYIRNPQIWSLP